MKFTKKQIPSLNYGVIHSQFGFEDGVSIVMDQVEYAMKEYLNIPASNIYYLIGKSGKKSKQITQRKILWHGNKLNKKMVHNFSKGYVNCYEEIEKAIQNAQEEITQWIEKKKIDILIIHNYSHPVNFIGPVALARYYRDAIKNNKSTPKYVLWWHDSHLERPKFENPSPDVKGYLDEGVPSKYVEYILFINSMQYELARKYYEELHKDILLNYDVVYNTATAVINNYSELRKDEFKERVEKFLEDFKIWEMLKKENLTLEDTQFCLQHTRIVPRKRIDFALKYAYELHSKLDKKAMIFFISGHTGKLDTTYKKELKKLNNKLSKQYNTTKFFLVFNEDFKTEIRFAEFPSIIARLGGVSTYFSEIEGFGNNLLEVMAGGLVPILYTYPVFIKDIAQFGFKCVSLDKFEIEKVDEVIKIINNDKLKQNYVNHNLKILKNKLSHKLIAFKLRRAIIRKRNHN